MLDLCRVEAPLSKTSAVVALSLYSRTKMCLNELETSVETYLDLVTLIYEEPPPQGPPEVEEDGAAVAPAPEVDGLQVLIDTHINNLAGYSTRVIDLRSNNIETFWSIDRALNPVVRIATSQVQATAPVPASGGFRLNPDLRPHILQKDCTLK